VKRRDRIRRQEPLDNVRNLQAQNARVSQASALNLSTGAADPTCQTFDSKKIAFGILSGDSQKKGAVPAAQIDFERRNPAVNGSKIEPFKIIRRNELSRRCWIC
jgi:hypothetical protein